ncbi:hypothetical protein HUJ05_007102 [Dendroctonus ponderosae]|nr:hypothetical protein HUJ05_007102 [Dendroctonus ponderosae]
MQAATSNSPHLYKRLESKNSENSNPFAQTDALDTLWGWREPHRMCALEQHQQLCRRQRQWGLGFLEGAPGRPITPQPMMSSEEETEFGLYTDKLLKKTKRTRQRVDAGEPRNSYSSIPNFSSRPNFLGSSGNLYGAIFTQHQQFGLFGPGFAPAKMLNELLARQKSESGGESEDSVIRCDGSPPSGEALAHHMLRDILQGRKHELLALEHDMRNAQDHIINNNNNDPKVSPERNEAADAAVAMKECLAEAGVDNRQQAELMEDAINGMETNSLPSPKVEPASPAKPEDAKKARVENIVSGMRSSPAPPQVNGCKKRKLYQPQQHDSNADRYIDDEEEETEPIKQKRVEKNLLKSQLRTMQEQLAEMQQKYMQLCTRVEQGSEESQEIEEIPSDSEHSPKRSPAASPVTTTSPPTPTQVTPSLVQEVSKMKLGPPGPHGPFHNGLLHAPHHMNNAAAMYLGHKLLMEQEARMAKEAAAAAMSNEVQQQAQQPQPMQQSTPKSEHVSERLQLMRNITTPTGSDLEGLADVLKTEISASLSNLIDSILSRFVHQKRCKQQDAANAAEQLNKDLLMASQLLDRKSPRTKVAERSQAPPPPNQNHMVNGNAGPHLMPVHSMHSSMPKSSDHHIRPPMFQPPKPPHGISQAPLYGMNHPFCVQKQDTPEQNEALSLVVAPKKKRHKDFLPFKVTDTRITPRTVSRILGQDGGMGMSPASMDQSGGSAPTCPSPRPPPYHQPPPMLPVSLPTSVAIPNPGLHESQVFSPYSPFFHGPSHGHHMAMQVSCAGQTSALRSGSFGKTDALDTLWGWREPHRMCALEQHQQLCRRQRQWGLGFLEGAPGRPITPQPMMSSEEETEFGLYTDKLLKKTKRTRQRVDAGEPRNSYSSIPNFSSRPNFLGSSGNLYGAIFTQHQQFGLFGPGFAPAKMLNELLARQKSESGGESEDSVIRCDGSPPSGEALAHHMLRDILQGRKHELLALEHDMRNAQDHIINNNNNDPKVSPERNEAADAAVAMKECLAEAGVDNRQQAELMEDAINGMETNSLPSPKDAKKARVENIVSGMRSSPAPPQVNGCKKRKLYQPQQHDSNADRYIDDEEEETEPIKQKRVEKNLLKSQLRTMQEQLAEMQQKYMQLCTRVEQGSEESQEIEEIPSDSEHSPKRSPAASPVTTTSPPTPTQVTPSLVQEVSKMKLGPPGPHGPFHNGLLHAPHHMNNAAAMYLGHKLLMEQEARMAKEAAAAAMSNEVQQQAQQPQPMQQSTPKSEHVSERLQLMRNITTPTGSDLEGLADVLKTEISASLSNLIDSILSRFVHQKRCKQQDAANAAEQLNKDLLMASQLLDRKSPRTKVAERSQAPPPPNQNHMVNGNAGPHLMPVHSMHSSMPKSSDHHIRPPMFQPPKPPHGISQAPLYGMNHPFCVQKQDTPEQNEALSLVVAPKKKRHKDFLPFKVTDTRITPRTVSRILGQDGGMGMSPASMDQSGGSAPTCPSPRPPPYHQPPPMLPVSLPTSVAIPNPGLHESQVFSPYSPFFHGPSHGHHMAMQASSSPPRMHKMERESPPVHHPPTLLHPALLAAAQHGGSPDYSHMRAPSGGLNMDNGDRNSDCNSGDISYDGMQPTISFLCKADYAKNYHTSSQHLPTSDVETFPTAPPIQLKKKYRETRHVKNIKENSTTNYPLMKELEMMPQCRVKLLQLNRTKLAQIKWWPAKSPDSGPLLDLHNPNISLTPDHSSTLTPMHLRKAKLMFFWVRYPSSAVLKMYFPDIKFNKNNTAQLVKWFSNFRQTDKGGQIKKAADEIFCSNLTSFALKETVTGALPVGTLCQGRGLEEGRNCPLRNWLIADALDTLWGWREPHRMCALEQHQQLCRRQRQWGLGFLEGAPGRPITPQPMMSSEEETEFGLYTDKLLKKTKRTRQRVDAGEPRNSYSSIPNFSSRPNFLGSSGNLYGAIFTQHQQFGLFGPGFAPAKMLNELLARQKSESGGESEDSVIRCDGSPPSGEALAHHMLRDILQGRKHELLALEHDMRNAQDHIINNNNNDPKVSPERNEAADAAVAMKECLAEAGVDNRQQAELMEDAINGMETNSLPSPKDAKKARVENIVSGMRSSPAPPQVNGCKKRKLYQPQQHDSNADRYIDDEEEETEPIKQKRVEKNLLKSQLRTMQEQLAEMQQKYMQLCTRVEQGSEESQEIEEIPSDSEHSPKRSPAASPVTTTSPPTPTQVTPSLVQEVSKMKLGPPGPHGPFHNGLLHAPHHMNNAAAMYLGHKLLMEQEARMAKEAAAAAMSNEVQQQAQQPQPMQQSTPKSEHVSERLQLMRNITTPTGSDLEGLADVLKTEISASLSNLIDSILSRFVHQKRCKQQDAANAAEQLNKDLLMASQLLDRKSPRTKVAERSQAPPPPNQNHMVNGNAGPHLMPVHSMHSSMPKSSDHHIRPPMFQPPKPPHGISQAPLYGMNHPFCVQKQDTPEQNEALSLVVAPKKKRHKDFLPFKVTDTRITPRTVSRILGQDGGMGMSPASMDQSGGSAPTCPSPRPPPYHQPPPMLPVSLPTSVAIPNPGLHESQVFSPYSPFFHGPSHGHHMAMQMTAVVRALVAQIERKPLRDKSLNFFSLPHKCRPFSAESIGQTFLLVYLPATIGRQLCVSIGGV